MRWMLIAIMAAFLAAAGTAQAGDKEGKAAKKDREMVKASQEKGEKQAAEVKAKTEEQTATEKGRSEEMKKATAESTFRWTALPLRLSVSLTVELRWIAVTGSSR